MKNEQHRFTKIVVFLLTLLFVMTEPFCTWAAEKNVMDNYIITTIYEQRQARRDTKADGRINYDNMYEHSMSIDMSEYKDKEADLAISMKLYVEQIEGDYDNIMDVISQYANVELANVMGQGDTYISWNKDFFKKTAEGNALEEGKWNDILLPFSAGKRNSGLDLSQPVKYFRFLIANLPSDIGIQTVRLKDVCIVDMSRKAQKDDSGEEKNWDTTYEVASLPLALDDTQKKTGGYIGAALNIDPTLDVTKHNSDKLQVQMDIEIDNKTNPGSVEVLQKAIAAEVELGSGGKDDANDLTWTLSKLPWQHGKATYQLKFSAADIQHGEVDLSKLNYIRVYFAHWPADEEVHIKVSNVKIVDVTTMCTLPTIFGDGMTFQQNKPIKVWGNAKAGNNITAQLKKNGQVVSEKTVKAGKDGKWAASLDAQKGSYDTYSMDILENGTVIKSIGNILIGEVWLASGQSNMALSVSQTMDSEDLLANADNDHIRMYLEPGDPNGSTGDQPLDPMDDVTDAYWASGADANAVSRTSAVAYSFAKTLQNKLNVPVAILNAPRGGTVIEGWMPREAIEADKDLIYELKKRGLYYNEDFWSTTYGTMSTLYNQKIGPITNFNIAGTIWYQGESNSGRPEIYDKELTILKKSWSEAFGFENNSMPFIYTQVAAGQYDNGNNNMQHLSYLAEAMTRAFRANENNNMAMLTIYDMPLTHVKNGVSSAAIHPRTKTPVGERFAESAMNMVYGKTAVDTAPVYKSMEVKGNAIYVTFDYAGDGVRVIDDSTLHGFAIAGSDGIYVNAKAEIVSADTVKVYNSRVKKPKNVTYAFSNLNQASNLINSSNIPAAPFRTQQVTDTDTVMTPTRQMTYFTALDWIYADQDVWVFDKDNPDPANQSLGFRPSWETENADYSYDTDKKAEGKASLKLDMKQAGNVSVGPILNYQSQKINLGNFKNISVKISNPSGAAKTVGLSIVSGGKTYTVMPENAADANVTLNKGDDFNTVTFDMTALKDGGNTAENAADLWKNIEKMAFTFDAANAGTVYIDDVSFGMTERAEEETDDPVAVFDAAGVETTNLKSTDRVVNVVEIDGRKAIQLDNNGYIHFATENGVISNEDHDLMFRVTFYDNINAAFGLQYNSTALDDNGNPQNCQNMSINRFGTGKWSTVSLYVNDASFRHAIFNKADFRFYGKGSQGTYISKIEVFRKSANPDEEQIGERYGASERTEFTGRSFAGYQAWFGTGGQMDSWGHYSRGNKEADGTAWPRKDHISIDYFPYVKDYEESALAQTGFANLGSGEPTKLYNSSDETVINTHFKWMHDYGIDGAAIQRFAGVIRGRTVYDTPEATQLYQMKTAAENNDSLFYIMYDISGGTQVADANDTASISPYVEDIKFDWVYNIEKALHMTNSKAYTTVNGKPVVCLWGTAVAGRPSRVADYQELIDFFHKRDCYVIFGVGRDWSVNADTMAKYGEIFKQVDMISPWLVGSNVGSNDAIDGLYKTFVEKDWAWCQANNVDYYPVVFSGFSWALWHGSADDKPNSMPRNAGQNLWYQAYKIKQLGIPSFYIAMFDEYDEGTAIAKNASDYFDIPTDQWFATASCDGYWLSEDFQLRVAGEANRMVKGEREAVAENPVEHSLGPVYYRNSFESMYVDNPNIKDGLKAKGYYPVDPCFKNDKELSKDGADASVAIERNEELAKTGNYMTTIKGSAEKDNASYLYQISETKIRLNKNMKLSWSVYAADEGGKKTFITLLCDDGSMIEAKSGVMKTNEWTDCSVYVGDKSVAGKQIVGIAIGYAGEAGDFNAYYDDIILEDGDEQLNAVNITVNKDGKTWTDSGKTFELIDADGEHMTDFSAVKDGTYRIFDKEDNVDTGVVAVVDGETCDVTVDYYTISFVTDDNLTTTQDSLTVVLCKGTAIKVPALTVKDGYHFNGWYKDKGFKNAAEPAKQKAHSTQTFYAEIVKDKGQPGMEEPGTEKPGNTEEPGNTEKPGNTEQPGTEKTGKIKLSAEKKVLGVKEKYKLCVKTSGFTGKVKFKTSNKKIAVVSKSGVITAKKKGTVVITAYTGKGEQAVCKVTVKKAPSYVKFTAKSKVVKKGKTIQLKIKLPKDSAGAVTYTSSNKKIVKVDKNGKIKALKKGKAVIRVKTYNKKTGEIVITVR